MSNGVCPPGGDLRPAGSYLWGADFCAGAVDMAIVHERRRGRALYLLLNLLNRHQELRYSWAVDLEAAGGQARITQICAAHQTRNMALDSLFSWFESRQVGGTGQNREPRPPHWSPRPAAWGWCT